MLGKTEGRRRGWDGWMASPTQWTWVWVNSKSWWWTGRPGMLLSMGLQSWTWLNDWTELNRLIICWQSLLEVLDFWSSWTTMVVDCHSFTALEQIPQRDKGLDRRLSTCTDTITSTVGESRGEIRVMRDPQLLCRKDDLFKQGRQHYHRKHSYTQRN